MPDPTPLQLMDRLLDALKEAGIGWCQGDFRRDESGPVPCYEKARQVCILGAMNWGVTRGVLRYHERLILKHALMKACDPAELISLNDVYGWDFARFREELAKREG